MKSDSRRRKIQVLRHFQHFPACACASKGAFLQLFRSSRRGFWKDFPALGEDFDGFSMDFLPKKHGFPMGTPGRAVKSIDFIDFS